jgi:hypothetical protein
MSDTPRIPDILPKRICLFCGKPTDEHVVYVCLSCRDRFDIFCKEQMAAGQAPPLLPKEGRKPKIIPPRRFLRFE